EARQRFLEIARRRGALAAAADVLLAAAKNAEAPQPRAEILGEVAALYEELRDGDRAEAIHQQVLDLAPEDPSIALPATRALARQADSGEQRQALMIRAAHALGDRLDDVPEAILAYRAVLDDFGADRSVLDALTVLYERAERWPDLAETLEEALALDPAPGAA